MSLEGHFNRRYATYFGKIVVTYYLFQGVTADENSANGHKKSGLQFFLNTQKGVKLNPKS